MQRLYCGQAAMRYMVGLCSVCALFIHMLRLSNRDVLACVACTQLLESALSLIAADYRADPDRAVFDTTSTRNPISTPVLMSKPI